MKVQYFKAIKRTNRFNYNQKVWIRHMFANHMWVWFKFRGKGRYVSGVLDKFAPCIGEIKEIEVEEQFGNRIKGILFGQTLT